MHKQENTFGEQSALIRFLGLINGETVKKLNATVKQLVAEGRTDIHLALKTPGGEEGFAGGWIYDQLKAMENIRLTTYCRMHVGSAGMHPYLAGQKRIVEPNADFLIHKAKFTEEQRNEHTGKHDELIAVEEIQNARIELLLRTETNMTDAQIADILATEDVTSAEKAVHLGIAHEIGEIIQPDISQIVDLRF